MLQEKPKADFIPPVSVNNNNQASYTDEDKVILMELMS